MQAPSAETTQSAWSVSRGDALDAYADWPTPSLIVSDGAYGVGGLPGDPRTADGLADWYEPHIEAWSKHARAASTLWFWNTELGWATVHPVLVRHGWEYVQTIVWDKGIAHIAGNVNGDTIRQFPVVTEVCVFYRRRLEFPTPDGVMSAKKWLRYPQFGYRTRDIDFTPHATIGNLNRVSHALYDLDAKVRHGAESFPFNHDGRSLSQASVWNLVCDYGTFDLSFKPTSMGDYDDIIANAQLVSITVGSSTIELPCASLAAIAASKQALYRDKDQMLLPLLQDQLEAERSAEPPAPGIEL